PGRPLLEGGIEGHGAVDVSRAQSETARDPRLVLEVDPPLVALPLPEHGEERRLRLGVAAHDPVYLRFELGTEHFSSLQERDGDVYRPRSTGTAIRGPYNRPSR